MINFAVIENLILWCIFPLALVIVIAFACNMYDEFMKEGKRKQSTPVNPPSTVIPKALTPRQLDRAVPQSSVIRGYDSPELFREDLWLLRIDQSRKAHARANGSLQIRTAGTEESSTKSICAMLAQHPGARCDN